MPINMEWMNFIIQQREIFLFFSNLISVLSLYSVKLLLEEELVLSLIPNVQREIK